MNNFFFLIVKLIEKILELIDTGRRAALEPITSHSDHFQIESFTIRAITKFTVRFK